MLGDAALAWLAARDEREREALPARFARLGAAVLIVAGDAAFDETPWRRAGLHCLASPLPAHRVVHALRQALLARGPRRTVHGVLLAVHGIGVLVEGPAAAGKSAVALDLIARGHRLVADDAVELWRPAPGILMGRSPQLLHGYVETRGLGVLDVRRMHGDGAVRRQVRVELIVRLPRTRTRLRADERLAGRRRRRTLLGVGVPAISLASRHNLAALIEAACLDERLRQEGLDAGGTLIRRQARAIRSTP